MARRRGGSKTEAPVRVYAAPIVFPHAHFCGICKEAWYCECKLRVALGYAGSPDVRLDHEDCLRKLGQDLTWCPVCVLWEAPVRFKIGVSVWPKRRKSINVCSRRCAWYVRREVKRQERRRSDLSKALIRKRIIAYYRKRVENIMRQKGLAQARAGALQ